MSAQSRLAALITAIGADIKALNNKVPANLVAALPATPVDGQEIYLQVDTAGTYGGPYVWHCRYRSAIADAYKWEVLSYKPLIAFVDDVNATSQSTAWSTAKTPSIVAPFAGVYDAWFSFLANGSSMGTDRGVFAGLIPDNVAPTTGLAAVTMLSPSVRYYVPSEKHKSRHTVTAGRTFNTYLVMDGQAGAELFSAYRRNAELHPIRIG